MSLDHAILGFLNYTPFSGPELKKVFDASVRHFWPADQSQIYRTLSRLSDSGWVGLERGEVGTRPEHKIYHITEAGRLELHRWLTAPPKVDEARRTGPSPVFLGGQLSDEEILATFERAAAQLRGLLARYEEVPGGGGERRDRFGSPREEHFWQLTLEYGISWAWAQLGWLESVIERIESGECPDA